MDEQLQKALAEIIGKVNGGIDGAASFMSAQIPDVVSQLLTWYATKSAIMCSLAVIVMVAWFFAERCAIKTLRAGSADFDDWAIVYGLLGSIARIMPILFVVSYLNIDWLQIWLAPKIWLIEYAASLAK